MRRIINNSTAIVACLSLLTPHLAWAQSEEATRKPAWVEELPPEAAAKKQAELEKKAKKELQNKRKAQEQKQPAEKKKAKEERQKKRAERQQKLKEQKQKRAEEQGKAQEERQKKQAERQKKLKEQEQKQAEAQRKERKERQTKRAERQQKLKEQEQKQAKEQRKAQEERRKEKQAEREQLQKQERKQAEQQRKDREERKEERRDAENNRRIRLSNSEMSSTRQQRMGGLNSVLQDEIGAGLNESRLTCLSGAAYPCADGGPAITPRGVVLRKQENGAFVMAPAKQQMYRVDGNGDVVPRVAEEGAVQTAIAKEVAKDTRIGDLAALLDGRKGKIVEQKVTEGNSRSSSEDFATSLRDALEGSNARSERRANDDDDDDNDLGKALLLGLGALAVGSMLNNNRQVALSSPDRVVVTRPDGSQEVIKDEVALLRQPGSTVTTENFDDGSSRTIVTRTDGSKIVTIRDANLRVLRRTLISADGRSTQLIDDTTEIAPVDIAQLPSPVPPSPYGNEPMSEVELREALQREADIDRRFSLAQIRNIPEVRSLVAPVNIDGITFDTGSAAIRADQAKRLSTLGNVIQDAIQENPNEIFLIEGHTDTVGASAMNLALSDRRAESVALALSEYYDVPPENLVVQGYGEQYLRVRSEGDVRANRRASIRRITDLLRGAE